MNQRGRTTGIVLDGGESPGVSIVDVQALFLDYGKFEAKAPPFP